MFGKKRKEVVSFESRVSSPEGTGSAPNSELGTHNSQPATSPSPLATRNSQPPQRRRGVLLLVVLSLLVLFMMIGTAFIVSTKQFEKGAKASQRAALQASDAASHADLLDEVLMQLVRDTNNPASSLRYHSLLEDLYGIDGWVSEIPPVDTPIISLLQPLTPAQAGLNPADVRTDKDFTVRWTNNGLPRTDPNFRDDVTHGQILEFDVVKFNNLYEEPHQPHSAGPPFPHAPNEFSPLDDAYAGQVVTFTSGPARGVSTRIVGSRFTQLSGGNWLTLRVQSFKLSDGRALTDNVGLQRDLGGARFVVNGRPFNGTGAGLNPQPTTPARSDFAESFSSIVNDPPVGSFPLALLPNSAFFGTSANNGYSLENVPDEYFLTQADGQQLSAYTTPLLYAVAKAGYKSLIGWNGRGGGDESYDVPDFQNMPLAMIPSGETPLNSTSWQDLTQAPPTNLGTTVLPSFHRPDLIFYWASLITPGSESDIRRSELGQEANLALFRKVMLRPTWLDHPAFTGSNPEFAAASSVSGNDEKLAHMIHGPWDVDNDNDGIRDSVWVDFGGAVMVGPEGKLVRPLAAILCVDMDGRVNVNTAGTLDIAAEARGDDWTISTFGREPNHRNVAGGAANGPAQAMDSEDLPRGMGATPGDISLEPAIGAEDFKGILVGDPPSNYRWPGRYGVDQLPGMAGFDVMAQINRYAWADKADQRSSIGSPLDVIGRYATGLNVFGQPMYESDEVTSAGGGGVSAAGWSLRRDAPTEMNLNRDGTRGMVAGAADMPFSPAELERAVRMFDADAGSLPRRLYDLSGTSKPDEYVNRLRITTDSNDVPAPNVEVPAEWQSANAAMLDPAGRRPQSVAELIEVRVRKSMNLPLFPTPITDPLQRTRVRTIVRQILAPELAAGLRLDINRPLGNGRDDNNNGVVDEPGEWDANSNGTLDAGEGEMVWDPNMSTGTAADNFKTAVFTPLDVNDNGNTDAADALQQRQLLARHLYVLALTTTAPADYDPGGANATAAQKDHQALARRLAQWAVNIVDFRDADNIMTSFEYDLNPFDGWNVNGDATKPIDGDFRTAEDHDPDGSLNVNAQGIPQGADSGDETIVWGLERPELVMTETLAWHDRRTDDSGQADSYPTEDGPDQLKGEGNPMEMDYDQLVRPRGAFFVELYNPWPTNLSANADTHRLQGGPNGSMADAGVDLARTHDGTLAGSPVWRMAIYKRATETKAYPEAEVEAWDPDDPDPKRRPQFPIDRSVYFGDADPDEANGNQDWDADGGAFFHNPGGRPIPAVRPGRFLVVGSGDDDDGDGVYEMSMADRKGERNTNVADPGPRRRIELNTNNVAHKVRMLDAVEGANASAFADTNEGYLVQAPSERSNGVTTDTSYPGDTSQCFTDVAIIDRAVAAVDEPKNNVSIGDTIKRRLSLSEPAQGYPYKFRAAEWDEDDQVYKSQQGAPTAIDIPLDGPLGGGAVLDANLQGNPRPFYLKNVDPVVSRVRDGETNPNVDPGATYSVIYLQRLANPLLPWNPLPGKQGYNDALQVNPYLTVDSTSANLTVFNSRGNDSGEEEDGLDANRPRRQFASHERGYTAKKQSGNASFMPELWSMETASGVRATSGRNGKKIEASPPNRYAPPYLQPALRASNSFWFNALPHNTLGFMNRSYFDPNEQNVGNANDNEAKKVKPRKPFPWLSWNNRPYVSGNELLLAPRSRSSKILRDFTTTEGADQSPYTTELDPTPAVNSTDKFPFGHLENYFYAGPTGTASSTLTHGVPQNLSRVLDYVTAPSLFAGTQSWLNPEAMAVTLQERQNGPMQPDDSRYNRQSPFNTVSEYREPGRVNLNTISTQYLDRDSQGNEDGTVGNASAWYGLHHGASSRDGMDANGTRARKVHPGPKASEFTATRRGYGSQGLSPNWPTIFGNPFRSQDTGGLVPLPTMVRDGLDASLYRTIDGTAGATAKRSGDHLVAAVTDSYFDEAKRNPYFRYQPISRLGSMVTTRSNVYAVWVTIGFFEVEEIQNGDPLLAKFTGGNANLDQARANPLFSRVYPEGVTLSQEVGAETGDTQRLRGFYILDRSIPAGFEPGKNVNVENVIRLKRKIE